MNIPLLPGTEDPPPKGKKRKRAADTGATSASAAALLASETFSPTALVGTGTLEGEPGAPEAAGGGEAADQVRIDFASLDDESRAAEITQASLPQPLRCICRSYFPNDLTKLLS